MKIALKYFILNSLGIWALLSVCIICGNSTESIDFIEIILRIVFGGASLALCIKTGIWCSHEDLLPRINEKEDEE